MKYHTTLSTIIISMSLLLLFVAVAVFCVGSLQITSPGLMLLSKATERLQSEERSYSFSFSSIDRIMDREIVIHDLSLSFKDENTIDVERVIVTQNPVSLFSKLILKQGSIRLELDNVEINHFSLPDTEVDGGTESSPLDIHSILVQIADIIEKRSSGYLSNFDYEIVLTNADINIEDSLRIQDCYSEIKVDRGLLLRNIYFDIPRLELESAASSISFENFVATIDRTDTYQVDAGFENLLLEMDGRRASAKSVSAISRFDSLATLDPIHFPLKGRLEDVVYSDDASQVNMKSIVVESEGERILANVDDVSVIHGEFSLSTDSMNTTLIGDITKDYHLNMLSDIPVRLYRGDDSFINFLGYKADLHYNGIYTLDAIFNDIEIPYSDLLTSSMVKDVHLENNKLNLQYNSRTLYVELDSGIRLESERNYIDGTNADFTLGFISEEGALDEVFFSLDSLYLPGVVLPFSGYFNYRDDRLRGNFQYSDSIVMNLDRRVGTSFTAEILSLNLIEFEPLISMITPIYHNYIAPETTLSGTFRLQSDGRILSDSSIYSSLAISNIRFNDFRFGLAGILQAGIHDSVINVNSLSATSEYLRATYSGNVSLKTLLPEGHFELSNPESGELYFMTDILLNENKAYLFNASLPTIYDSSLSGIVERRKDRSIAASGTLVSGISTYPVDFIADPVNGFTRFTTDGFNFALDARNNMIAVNVEFNTFRSPVRSEETTPLIINGSLNSTFNFEDQRIFGSTGGFDLIGFRFLPSNPSIHFMLDFDNDHIAVNDIYLIDKYPTIYGKFFVDQKRGSMAGHLGNSDEGLDISIMKKDREYTGIIDIENLKLDRYGFDDIAINASLTGRGSNMDEFTFSGSMAASPLAAMDYGLRSDIVLTSDSLTLNNFNFSTSTLNIHSDSISYLTAQGSPTFRYDIDYVIKNKDRDYPVDLAFSGTFGFPKYDNFIDLIFNIGDYLEGGGLLDADLHLDNFSIDNGLSVRNRDIALSFGTDGFTADGDLVKGSYDFDSRAMDLTILDNEILSGHFKGSIRLPEYDMEIDGLKFNLHTIVSFLKYPIFYFGKDSYAGADLRIYGKGTNNHIFGNIYSDNLMMSTWWVDQDDFVATNIKMTIIDNELDSGTMPIAVINRESGAVREGMARFYGFLGGPNFVDHIAVDVHADKEARIHIICPVSSYNVQLSGYGWGDFTYDSELWLQHLSGDLYIEDFDIGVGLDPLPYWWESYMQFTDDFIVRFANNVRFIMPKSDEPIMTAYLKEGDSIHFTYDTRYMNATVDGNIGLKGGEIYYINKNFYITEGTFNFPANTLKEPRLSLRARLTDFDSDGNKVDIYLVLNNSTLDNLNPHFESSPQKSMEEIMSILGNNIISNDENGSGNLSSVASLVSSGMDAMGRVGMINNNFSTRSLTDSIRESLHLDMFSMRTQLFQNVLLDSVFPGDTVYSPMSRYFNNTTVFFGKQVTDDLFLQGLIRLNSKEKRKNKNPFLTDDLLLDFEVSIEWENPIGTISFFTNPVNLLPYNMYENFGISYKKRLVF